MRIAYAKLDNDADGGRGGGVCLNIIMPVHKAPREPVARRGWKKGEGYEEDETMYGFRVDGRRLAFGASWDCVGGICTLIGVKSSAYASENTKKCVNSCPEKVITRVDTEEGGREYVSNPAKYIGCGICADVCPCGS